MEWMSFVIRVIPMRSYDVVIVVPEVVFYRQCGSAETSNFIYSVFCFKAFVWRPALRALAATAAIYQPALMSFSRGFSVFSKPPQSRLNPGGRTALRHQGCLVVNHHKFLETSVLLLLQWQRIWIAAMMPIGLVPVPEPVCLVSDHRSKPHSCVLTEPSAAVLKVNCANMQGLTGDPIMLSPN